ARARVGFRARASGLPTPGASWATGMGTAAPEVRGTTVRDADTCELGPCEGAVAVLLAAGWAGAGVDNPRVDTLAPGKPGLERARVAVGGADTPGTDTDSSETSGVVTVGVVSVGVVGVAEIAGVEAGVCV